MFPGGATLLEEPAGWGEPRAWVLVDGGDHRAFGAAMAWAALRGGATLDLVVDEPAGGRQAGLLAWRAAAFARPPAVWSLRGRDLTEAAPLAPDPEPPVPGGAWPQAAPLGAVGVEVVAEHGVARGEVLGLEVARVVDGPSGWRLEVGVGAHDRAALAELRPGEDPLVALERAAGAVRAHRRPGVPRHPANTLARERWLRRVLVARPELAGAAALGEVSPAWPRRDLLAPSPAPAAGSGPDGRGLLVVASAGVDTDLVPAAADARRLRAPGADLVIVVPEGDDHPVTRRLAAETVPPAAVVTVPAGWEWLGP